MLSLLTEVEFQEFNEYVEKAYGLKFDINRAYLLENPLEERIQALGLPNFKKYFERIKQPLGGKEELFRLVQLLTVGETYFFRNPYHMRALSEFILPELTRAKKNINIFSAGCSTGEEPFTLSILCKAYFPEITYKIIATDINQAAFVHAKKGLFSQRSVQNVPKPLLSRFFTPVGNQYQLASEIIESVFFLEGNLNAPSLYKGLHKMDLLLCRNVLIYFSKEAIRQILTHFHKILNPTGYLILGHSETLRNLSDDFQMVEHSGTFFYQTKDGTNVQSSTSIIEQKPFSKVSEKETTRTVSSSVRSSERKGKLGVVTSKSSSPPIENDLFPKGIDLFNKKQTKEAVAIFEKILSVSPRHEGSLMAMALYQANLGNFKEAMQWCEKASLSNTVSPEIHYVKGLLLESQGLDDAAKVAYSSTIFLKRNWALAHFRLGKIHLKNKMNIEANKSFSNTIKYLNSKTDDLFLFYSGGFPVESIERTCQQFIQRSVEGKK